MEQIRYYENVLNILKFEANKIKEVSKQLNPKTVEKAIEMLLACKGKVITIGIGKSGLIAQKFAATLTSTGTPAVYLHPAEAMHGDLGIASSLDVVVVISNGGESEEIVNILPYLKARGINIIALVGNLKSTLARKSDVILNIIVDKEADIYNIVPSTSTTVALALADGLALTVMKEKGIKPEDFAFNHPSGRLGKRLNLSVGDLMYSGKSNPIVKEHCLWYEVIKSISNGGLGAVSVVDEQAKVLGIITDGDVRRILEKKSIHEIEKMTSSMMMTMNPITVMKETLAYDAMNIMENRSSQISVLPVVTNDNICIGMIRLHDIVRSGL
jgi:arabinose-5-phosphate isomerase